MRKLTLYLAAFTMLFSVPSSAEWTKTYQGRGGNTFYVDFTKLQKVDGYVYWWSLIDQLKPMNGYLSGKSYQQGDCTLSKFKTLSIDGYKEPMGEGLSESQPWPEKYQNWQYPPPDTPAETDLKLVCKHAEKM